MRRPISDSGHKQRLHINDDDNDEYDDDDSDDES